MGDGEDTDIALFASTVAADAVAADAVGIDIGIGDAVAREPSAPARRERGPGSFCVEFIADAPP